MTGTEILDNQPEKSHQPENSHRRTDRYNQSAPLDKRRAGILLHLTSLPGPYGNGVIGEDAYRFVDFLKDSGFSVWQTLPLGPTHGDGSPYQSLSVHDLVPAQSCISPGNQTQDRVMGSRRELKYLITGIPGNL